MFGIHWIPTHRGNLGPTPDREIFARWAPGFVKIICIDERPPYLEDVPAGAQIIIRNHPMSEDGARNLSDSAASLDEPKDPAAISAYGKKYSAPLFDAAPGDAPPSFSAIFETPEQIGRRHAETCNRMAQYCESKGVRRGRLLFEGLNEPQLWAGEPPEWITRYYRAFLVGLHGYGLFGVVGNFGVGWPGNGGVQDAPVQWDFFKPAIAEFHAGDYLGLHEYWALNGPQENWRWWGGRFLQCPYKVPILITETGIDTGVTGQWYGGWRDLPGGSENLKAMEYVSELLWYAEQCAADGRVKQIFPFTYDIGSSHWEKFDIRSWAFLDALFVTQDQWPQPGGVTVPPPPVIVTPPPDVETTVRQAVWNAAEIAYNPEAALARYAREHGLGNPVTEETDAGGYRAQGFAKKIIYCPIGQWDRITEVDW